MKTKRYHRINIITILHNNMIWLVPHHRGDHRCVHTTHAYVEAGEEREVLPSVAPASFSVTGPYAVHP